jgi:hypothetical protein
MLVSQLRGGGRRESAGFCWSSGGEWLAGGDGWVYSNRFNRLECRFSVQCVESIGVLRARYMCMLIGIWVVICSYIRIIILLGKVRLVCCLSMLFVYIGLCGVSAIVGTRCDCSCAFRVHV